MPGISLRLFRQCVFVAFRTERFPAAYLLTKLNAHIFAFTDYKCIEKSARGSGL